MSPNPNTPEINMLASVQYSIVSSQLSVNTENAKLIADYRTKHDNWRINEMNHPGMQPEPQPPLGYVIGWEMDPTTGPGSLGPYGDNPIYYPSAVLGTAPVCPPLPRGLPVISSSLSTAQGGLMGALVAEGGVKPGDPTIQTVALFEKAKDSAGNLWMRLA